MIKVIGKHQSNLTHRFCTARASTTVKVTVTLTDAIAGIGLAGTLTIPNNDPAGATTLTFRGTGDNTSRLQSVELLETCTGPAQVGFNSLVAYSLAQPQAPENFSVVTDGGATYVPVSTAYAETGEISSVILTLDVPQNEFPSRTFRVRMDGTKVLTAN